jgi:hypothetical protein
MWRVFEWAVVVRVLDSKEVVKISVDGTRLAVKN